MIDLVDKALLAKRESKYIEFKSAFDPAIPGEWCELIKDIVAMANTGGGIIVFGLGDQGIPSGVSVDTISTVDPADISNKISKYTGPADLEIEILPASKKGHKLVAFRIHAVSIPLVFQKPGTYDIGSGRQRTAFSSGTIYFRHGAKSEPGTTSDIHKVIERQLEFIRKSWLKGVRKVVQAPAGAQIVAVAPPKSSHANAILTSAVRVVNDPTATPVRLTRDPTQASGSFVHEEISDGIFDEINNVIDANKALAQGQKRFFLGQSVYYRIYAERQHVVQDESTLALLLHSGMSDFYAPFMFWIVLLPPKLVAATLADLYLHPKSPHIHALMRTAIVLGPEFSKWLYEQWHSKWKGYSQPPSFYWAFHDMMQKAQKTDYRLIAAHSALTTQIEVEKGVSIRVEKMLETPEVTASALSRACMSVFQGTTGYRTGARTLDYLAYASLVRSKAAHIQKAVLTIVGSRSAGDVTGSDEAE